MPDSFFGQAGCDLPAFDDGGVAQAVGVVEDGSVGALGVGSDFTFQLLVGMEDGGTGLLQGTEGGSRDWHGELVLGEMREKL